MASSRRQYPFHLIEPRWQRHWDAQQTFRAFNPGETLPAEHPFAQRHGLGGRKARADELPPKYYILDMFPYPSGAGLHVGHPEGYTATDILARYRRARGFHVLHPMGWDAFGLPAEQYAVKTGQHPRVTTEANIATFKRQIQSLGFSYDWSREVATTDPEYFRWTQWIFLQLYNAWFNPETNRAEPISTLKYPPELQFREGERPRESYPSQGSSGDSPSRDLEAKRRAYRDSKRLAYVSEAPVNWCPELGTVLANEEVIDGKSEVGGFPVIRRPMRQWMLRITAYAEKLLNDLDTIDWSDSLKEMQRNWIGRSEGAEVQFQISNSQSQITVFTTRPDTLFGATYMVLSPEHKLVDQIIPASWPCEVPQSWIQNSPAARSGEAVTDQENAVKRAAHFGTEVVDLRKLEIPPDVLAIVSGQLARRHRVIPVCATSTTVTVALSDPSDITALDELHTALKRDVSVSVATPADIESAIHKYYHPSPREAVESYRTRAAGKSDLERTELAKEKTGVFTGAHAINPVNGEKIPIWIADYVLASYGTGAIMAVPAHDTRDFEFATKFNLPIVQVVQPPDPQTDWRGFVDDGTSVSSTGPEISITGLPTPEAKKKITAWLESKGLGKKTVNYKLRDWLFSRQRYWGEPFPIVWKKDAAGNLYHEALPESALPVLPPSLDDYKPTADGQPPLARAKDWVNLPDGSTRETNTMPQWAGSCWYYLRYLDARNNHRGWDGKPEQYWMGFSPLEVPRSAEEADQQISELVNYALSEPGAPRRRVAFGQVGAEEAAQIREKTGLDLTGFLFVMDSYGVRHAWKEHNSEPAERKHGQRAITADDFRLVPLVVLAPDGVEHLGKSNQDLDVLRFSKRIDGVMFVVDEVLTGQKQLALKTAYIRTVANDAAIGAPLRTAETDHRLAEALRRHLPHVKQPTPGIDLYVGGTEHAVLHLLYARFWHKVLFDLGHVSTPEPFFKLVNQGLILGEDGQKMSKSRGNVINPDDILKDYGADAFRLYEMFMGPLEMVKPWNTKGVEGVYRFLGRVWRLFVDEASETEFEQNCAAHPEREAEFLGQIKLSAGLQDAPATPAQLKTLHACIKKVTEDLDGLRFNTAISAMMVFVNEAMTWPTKPVSVLRDFLILLQPFAPHLAEELWAKIEESQISNLKSPTALAYAPWPAFDPALLVEDTMELPVQVNGKLRDKIVVPAAATVAEIEQAALAAPKARPFLEGKTIKKIIVVPKRMVSIAAA